MTDDRRNGLVATSAEIVSRGEILAERHKEEIVERKKIEGPAASVGVNMGTTINLGNFQSARIDVQVTLPCAPEDVEATYKEVCDFARTHIREEAKSIREMAAAQKKGKD